MKEISFKLGYDKKGNPHIYKKIGEGKFRRTPTILKGKETVPPIPGIFHIVAGIENVWEPTPDELDAIAGLFMQGFDNPGSIVVTRTGITVDFYPLGEQRNGKA